jgi:hypothetical protein
MSLGSERILIVTGAHLEAEVVHRPMAYRLREHVLRAIGESERPERVVVCSDLWYLNHAELRGFPTVSIGGPRTSALTAYLALRLPSVLAVDGLYVVQMDLEGDAPVASCWGETPEATATAVQAFEDRFLDAFLAGMPGW